MKKIKYFGILAMVFSVMFVFLKMETNMDTIQIILGALSFSFGITPFVSYVKSILDWHKTGKGTQPTRVTLLIWATLDVVMFLSYFKENSWNTMTYMLLAYMIGAISVSYVALKHGSWGATKEERRESFIVLTGAFIGIVAWYMYHSALIGHYIFVVTLIISVLPLVKKIYQKPWTEDLFSWSLWFMANIFTFASIILEGWTIENGLLTAVYFVLYIVILFPLIRFESDKRFLKKSKITAEFDSFIDKKIMSSPRLTKAARGLGLIKENEELKEIYCSFGRIKIRKEKVSEYIELFTIDVQNHLIQLDNDENIEVNSAIVKNIILLLRQGKYFSAKEYFKWEGDKLLNEKRIYNFLKEKFKE